MIHFIRQPTPQEDGYATPLAPPPIVVASAGSLPLKTYL